MPSSITAYWRKPSFEPVVLRSRNVLVAAPAWVALVVACVVIASGCRKPEEDLGLDLLPGEQLGVGMETAVLNAHTFQDSAVQTGGLTRHLVGSYVDPDFGLLKAGLAAQLRLTTANVGQGQTGPLIADSIVLGLVYETPNTHYGNLTTQQFRVHEIIEGLSVDTLYRSNAVPVTASEDLVYPHRGMVTPDPYSPVRVGNDTVAPQLRFRLRDELADRIVAAFGTSDLADNTSFLNFFKGIFVSVDNGVQAPFEGGVLHINTSNASSKVTLYYRRAEEPDVPLKLDLVINGSSARFTSIHRDRSQALNTGLVDALADPDAAATTVYLQTLGGCRTRIGFPEIMSYASRGQALAKAELVVPLQGSYYPYYTPPSLAFLFRKNTDGTDAFLPDQQSGIGSIGGSFDLASASYRFNITRYLSQVLNGTLANDGLVLVAGSSGVSANRAVLCGPDHPATPMRLLLTFTTY